MAIINFGFKNQTTQEQVQNIIDSVIKTRDRSDEGLLKRVLNEQQAIGGYLEKQTVSDRGDKSSDELLQDALNAMEEQERKLYQIWQLELSESTINNQGGIDNILEGIKKSDPNNIEFVELNHSYRLSWTPSDPQFSNLYGLQKIECEKAWNISKGKGITVAVIDSGVNIQHTDLARNLARDADRKIIGHNFVADDSDLSDAIGHGTHIAGIIAAVGNNRKGVIGVAPEAKIIPIKAFSGRTSSSIILANAIKYAVDKGAQVINNSWANDERIPHDETLRLAINYALGKGVVCVFAAGNKNENVRNYWIALEVNTIVVAATDQLDRKAPGSNWGNEISVAAPGFEIISLDASNNNGLIAQNGTSMAAAHVSGAVALYLAKHGSTPIKVIKDQLKSNADYIATSVALGSGRLNCYNFINK
ncbi:MAG TPA: S8 family serine peptidase [Haliscomenobacter sp.]|uniref:S8 family serine peptidase n=1 Tax=Haliscomenobacter sp. TaxID=2717303 RepID=UPI002B86B957|nr:S8 family serine peptidase [Haliscomenobacter sp.]HOY15776.1 S8 family serine peptidase [Haliscomenobacter sp.]